MLYKFFICVLISLLNIVILGNPTDHQKSIGFFHIIKEDKIQTMEVHESGEIDDEIILEIKKDERVADIEILGMSDVDINKLIAKRILNFEGEKVVHNSTEYSKYGITIETLERYNMNRGTRLVLENLTQDNAMDIIIHLMNRSRVNEIKDPRIRIIVFDTMFNTGNRRAARITQRTYNFYNDLYGDGKRLDIDGILGNDTIEKLNNIKKTEIFVQLFIFERLNTYKKFREWDKYKEGWTKRILSTADFNI